MKIAVIGGDRRQALLAEKLRDAGHTVAYEAKPAAEGPSLLFLERLTRAEAVVLPVPVSRDGQTLAGTKWPLPFLYDALPPAVPVFGGALPAELRECRLHRDYLQDESFVLRNACLTAEGTIRLLYENTERALADTSFLILGYGRIGTFLLRRLVAFGAHVTVAARRAESRAAARLSGAETVSFRGFMPRVDVVINTVPPPFSPPEMSRGTRFTDLAGLPAETVPGYIVYTAAPGLPGKYFPESAAEILLSATLEYLKGDAAR